MKITYISHATLLIEIDNVKIVTDPWVTGSAYCEQWYLFPKPINQHLITDANFVIYTHGHEDHLHAESLALINKNASIYYPYSWYGGTTEFFNEQGFANIKEALNEKTITLSNDIKLTYLSNNLDNVLVIEHKDEVLVNINDALPSASAEIIDYFIEKINKRWKKIDYVFSSYGGASYFPNTVHFTAKNDIEIGETRELFFINNFCKIIKGLNPKLAIPFASDFILLDDHQRWINSCKFQRKDIKAFYDNYTNNSSNTLVVEAYSGDYFLNQCFFKESIYHKKNEAKLLIDSIDEDYKQEIEHKRNVKRISQKELNELFENIKQHIIRKQYIIPEEIREKIAFAIKITDAKQESVLNINFRNGDTTFTISDICNENVDLLIEIKSKSIAYSIGNEWGGDAIIIGYAAEIFIYSEDCITKEYENYCIRLLTRYPNTKEYLKKEPLRALKYLLSDSTKTKNLLHKLTGSNHKILNYTDSKLGNRNLWLTKSKCDVCKACNI